ncbi:MAG: EboA domain-containing protein [SAR324 cluster bacterium]|nr:EboA domain-containing protein [SAR324 cluster bacterium]
MKQHLHDLLRARAGGDALAWLEKALAATTPPVHHNTLLGYYSGASRRMGKRALNLSQQEQARGETLDAELALSHWGADEAARALLLLTLAEQLPPEEFAELARRCYELGDSREQESWLRGLGPLPDCARFLASAVDACRTNIIPVFEAIACENPYPLRVFPEANFNQLILKSLFNGIALERIVGLEARLNASLSRMSDDYVSEREAAGRTVPTDIWLVLAPHIAGEGLVRVHRYLSHEDPAHRYWAALGLGHHANGESREALRARAALEREPRVKAALDGALARMG